MFLMYLQNTRRLIVSSSAEIIETNNELSKRNEKKAINYFPNWSLQPCISKERLGTVRRYPLLEPKYSTTPFAYNESWNLLIEPDFGFFGVQLPEQYLFCTYDLMENYFYSTGDLKGNGFTKEKYLEVYTRHKHLLSVRTSKT